MPAWDVEFVLDKIAQGLRYPEIAATIGRHPSALLPTLRKYAPQAHKQALASGYAARLDQAVKGKPLDTARLKFNQLRHYARNRLPWLDASAIEEKARAALYSRACAEGLTGNGKLPRTKKQRAAVQQKDDLEQV